MPRLSIILPYHNREDFLPRTLRSILRARALPLQLILVDNGSTDTSRQICLNFEQTHSKVDFKIINISEPLSGVCRARNAGLREATSHYVFFFDSDDELSPNFLTDALQLIDNTPSPIDIVAAPTEMVFLNGKTKERYTSRKSSLADQTLTGMLSTQSMLFHKDFLLKHGGWNEELPKWNDWELGIRALKNNAKIVWLDGPYHKIYQHSLSLSSMPRMDNYAAILKALQSVAPLVVGDPKAQNSLAVRALLVAEDLRRCGFPNEARQLEREYPLPHNIRTILHLHARIYNKGVWRLARFLV